MYRILLKFLISDLTLFSIPCLLWPIHNWSQTDLLLGRGGETNTHSGNIKFRKLIEEFKPIYIAAPRREKPDIAKKLVAQWKAQDPPGRFLEKRSSCRVGGVTPKKLWYEISDEAAKKRASKSLGEKQKVGSLLNANKESQSGGKKQKPSLKTRLRILEARAAATEGGRRPSPRGERSSNLSFPLAQGEGMSSFLYRNLPIGHFGQGSKSQKSSKTTSEAEHSLNFFGSQDDAIINKSAGWSNNSGTSKDLRIPPLPHNTIEPLDFEDHSPTPLDLKSDDDTGMNLISSLFSSSSTTRCSPSMITESRTPPSSVQLFDNSSLLPALHLQAATDMIISGKPASGAQDLLFSNGTSLAQLQHAVPTAAELTECWENEESSCQQGQQAMCFVDLFHNATTRT